MKTGKPQATTYRDAIVKEAIRLFAEKGFLDTSTAELAKAAGAAESTIFHHFRHKEDLLLEALDRVGRDLVSEVERTLRGEEFASGLERALGIVAVFFHLAEKMRPELLFLFRNYPYRLAEDNPTCREALERVHDCFVDIFADAIRAGNEDGSIRRGNPHKQAMVLFAMVSGLLRLDLLGIMPAGGLHEEAIACAGAALRATPGEGGEEGAAPC